MHLRPHTETLSRQRRLPRPALLLAVFLAASTSCPVEDPLHEAPVPRAAASHVRGDHNGNGIEDWVDIAVGTSLDENNNAIPDELEAGFQGNSPGGPSVQDSSNSPTR